MRLGKRTLAVVAMAATAALLSGCASGGGGGGADDASKTLTLWDFESDTSAMGIAWNQAYGFQAWVKATFGEEFHDFAGSVVVHAVGGWIALMAVVLLGARTGRYTRDGRVTAQPPSMASMPSTRAGASRVR